MIYNKKIQNIFDLNLEVYKKIRENELMIKMEKEKNILLMIN